jgi:hypothetical protein
METIDLELQMQVLEFYHGIPGELMMNQQNLLLQKSREPAKSNNRTGKIVRIHKYQAMKANFSCNSDLSQHQGVP